MAWFRGAALTGAGLVVAAGLVVLATTPSAALDGANLRLAQAGDPGPFPEEPVRPRRVRTQIEVTPVRPMHRECTFRLVQEFRPSGTVIVPRERCRWVR
jgi:hypothetical protein